MTRSDCSKMVVGIAVAAAGFAVTSDICRAASADKGLELVTKHCARCHAVGATSDSMHKEAPPFRSVVTRYPIDNLAEALAEGIISGHPDMPEFVFQPNEVSAILNYLEKLKASTNGGTSDPSSAKQKQ